MLRQAADRFDSSGTVAADDDWIVLRIIRRTSQTAARRTTYDDANLTRTRVDLLQILILAVVQGAAELWPVSSSAHVIVAEKLMGLDPTAPQMTLLLVMLHAGTMFAVIAYFWKSWRVTYFESSRAFRTNALHVVAAMLATAVVGLALLQVIKHVVAGNAPGFEIEQLFGNSKLMAAALLAAGMLIIVSSRARDRGDALSLRSACGSARYRACACRFGVSRARVRPSRPVWPSG